MKTVSIPFFIFENERMEELFAERILKVFLGLNAKRVSLVFKKWLDFDVNLPFVKKAIEYFAKYDIEVAIWLNSLHHVAHDGDYVKKRYADGAERNSCPLDHSFIKDFAKNIARYAETGVPLIYLDDDFRINCSGGFNCFCDLHMQEYKKIFGEGITREKLVSELSRGKPSVYRDAFVKINGETLKNAARIIREVVDTVDPSVRVGLCAAPTTMFGLDGVTAFELSEILAGKNEPFLRTIGAPYWAYFAYEGYRSRLSDVIALERWQANYAETIGFKGEMIAEGDTFPRPRYATPASFLEMFHSAVCTEKRMDGILKYLGEYTCKGTSEIGYSKLALKNKAKLDETVKAFENTKKTGFQIFEVQDKMKSMEILPDDFDAMDYQATVLPASVRALNDASIPYTFVSDTAPIVAFGDNANYLTEEQVKRGVFTDLVGAKILKEKGIDVGFTGVNATKKMTGCAEEYAGYNDASAVNFVHTHEKRTVEFSELVLKEKAEVLTWVQGHKNLPITYRYETEKGKLLVCAVDMMQSRFGHGLFSSYYKQKLLVEQYKWFTGEDLSAVCLDCPMVMPIVGEKENTLVIGLWNVFEDEIFNQPILLKEEYSKATCIGCTGTLQGKTFTLDTLSAFDYCVIVLEK